MKLLRQLWDDPLGFLFNGIVVFLVLNLLWNFGKEMLKK